MLTAFGPIGRWKLAGADNAATAGDGGAAAARLRQRRYLDTYQRFRHHVWILFHVLGG